MDYNRMAKIPAKGAVERLRAFHPVPPGIPVSNLLKGLDHNGATSVLTVHPCECVKDV